MSCLEGYYDNTSFHRIVPGFIMQGGDPTGSGEGGESIYDEPFVDEFHSRLRFVRRGFVGMASVGPNTNQSQFFITLDRADELTKVNTLFAKVGGNTIFNVLKVADLEIEDERPLYPPRILSTEVVYNPFDDLIPRVTVEEKRALEVASRPASVAVKKRQKVKKNTGLLSFGLEVEELDAVPAENVSSLKMKSSHDLLDDTRLDKATMELGGTGRQQTEKLSKNEHSNAPDDCISEKRVSELLGTKRRVEQLQARITESDAEELMTGAEFDKLMRDRIKLKSQLAGVHVELQEPDVVYHQEAKKRRTHNDSPGDVKIQIAKIKDEIRNITAKSQKKENDGDDEKLENTRIRKVSYLQEERQKFIRSKAKSVIVGRRAEKNENDTLAKLKEFTSKLWESSDADDVTNTKKTDEVARQLEEAESSACQLHGVNKCLSCSDTFGLMETETDEGWLSHRLAFKRDAGSKRDDFYDYEVIDPRERGKQAAEEAAEHSKGRNRHADFRRHKDVHQGERRDGYEKGRRRDDLGGQGREGKGDGRRREGRRWEDKEDGRRREHTGDGRQRGDHGEGRRWDDEGRGRRREHTGDGRQRGDHGDGTRQRTRHMELGATTTEMEESLGIKEMEDGRRPC